MEPRLREQAPHSPYRWQASLHLWGRRAETEVLDPHGWGPNQAELADQHPCPLNNAPPSHFSLATINVWTCLCLPPDPSFFLFFLTVPFLLWECLISPLCSLFNFTFLVQSMAHLISPSALSTLSPAIGSLASIEVKHARLSLVNQMNKPKRSFTPYFGHTSWHVRP